MDPRTLRAAVVADLSTFLVLWGLLAFLGLPMVTSLVVGLVAGTLAFALIALAARRSEGFSPTDPTDHLRLDRDLQQMDAPVDPADADDRTDRE